MSLVETRVEVKDLKLGMYVSRLDRPWLETDFKVQGGIIRSQKDIDRFARCCKHVYIDEMRSNHLDGNRNPGGQVRNEAESGSREQKKHLIQQDPVEYPPSRSFSEEIHAAQGAHAQLTRQIHQAFEGIRQEKKLDVQDLDLVVEPMVDSMVRNPDAFTWLSRMRVSNDYSYQHAINTSIWAIAVGRHLGLPRDLLRQLGIGGLLLDVGKLRLPRALIEKPGLYDERERKAMQRHVAFSREIVSGIKGISPEVLTMVETHHERHDGSGYPRGLKSSAIPLVGRIMGLADCYDAITTQRVHASALSPHEVVKLLFEWRGSLFQPELVEQFIQVIGVYPVGTLVELSTGQVAVVIAQHRTRRLRPKVMLLLDAQKRPYAEFDVLDLKDVLKAPDGQDLDIRRTLDPGSYDIDPEVFYL